MIFKNKKKIEAAAQAKMLCEELDEKYARQWDSYLEVLKNRNGQYEGKIGFEFDSDSMQFKERRGSKAKQYINYSKD